MRKLWFGVSLVAVFVFAAASSYIFFVLTGGRLQVDEPGVASRVNGVVQAAVTADTTLTVREAYACGYLAERELAGGGEFAGCTLDELAGEGWAVARIGEGRVEISRRCKGYCPIEQEKRLMRRTERGVAVYAGEAGHLGALLLEMPLDFAELPGELNAALAGDGYQLASRAELDELLENLDELVPRD